jgi:hypothetical protein
MKRRPPSILSGYRGSDCFASAGGPAIAVPEGSKAPLWHGQKKRCFVGSHETWQPRWGHVLESAMKSISGSSLTRALRAKGASVRSACARWGRERRPRWVVVEDAFCPRPPKVGRIEEPIARVEREVHVLAEPHHTGPRLALEPGLIKRNAVQRRGLQPLLRRLRRDRLEELDGRAMGGTLRCTPSASTA